MTDKDGSLKGEDDGYFASPHPEVAEVQIADEQTHRELLVKSRMKDMTKKFIDEQQLSGGIFQNFYLNIELVHPLAELPERAIDSDAGMDVRTPVPVTIDPHADVCIPLGWKCEFPKGFALIFWEKSGIATKKKLDIGAAVVDAGYRGIVHCHLFNNSDETVTFNPGDKVGQFIILPVWHGKAKEVESVDANTERGEGGFGHTGD